MPPDFMPSLSSMELNACKYCIITGYMAMVTEHH